MSLSNRVLAAAPALLAAMGCAKGAATTGDAAGTGSPDGSVTKPDANPSCGDQCDTDGDGVPDRNDQCPGTPAGQPVNTVGCADSQLSATLNPNFPPYGLTFTPSGDPGRAGGLTWTYAGMQRGDLFHIYWILCDDPATPCGISLDGAVDVAAENFQFSASGSNLGGGTLVLTNTTHIALADGSAPQLSGRLTVTIVDQTHTAIPFADVGTLHVTARTGQYGAEILGTGYTVTMLAEVQDPSSGTWTPYLDYYDAQPTPTAGGGVSGSFEGSFYDK